MAISVFEVSEVLGVQATDDGRYMLVGTKNSKGEGVALALDEDAVWAILPSIVEATSISPFKKGSDQEVRALDTDWFEIGRNKGSGDFAITFCRGKGHVSFALTPAMTRQIVETLSVALGDAVSQSSTSTSGKL
jgi:hypothetical protein